MICVSRFHVGNFASAISAFVVLLFEFRAFHRVVERTRREDFLFTRKDVFENRDFLCNFGVFHQRVDFRSDSTRRTRNFVITVIEQTPFDFRSFLFVFCSENIIRPAEHFFVISEKRFRVFVRAMCFEITSYRSVEISIVETLEICVPE